MSPVFILNLGISCCSAAARGAPARFEIRVGAQFSAPTRVGASYSLTRVLYPEYKGLGPSHEGTAISQFDADYRRERRASNASNGIHGDGEAQYDVMSKRQSPSDGSKEKI